MRRRLLLLMFAGFRLGHGACQTGGRPSLTGQSRAGATPLMASAKDKVRSPMVHPGVRFHTKPKPLPTGAVTHDWTSFLGPTHNAVSTETKLLKDWPAGGPSPDLGAEQGNRLRLTGDLPFSVSLFLSTRRPGNRRLPALRKWGPLLDLSLPDSVSGPLRLQQWPSLQSGDRRESSLYLRRPGKTPLS